jgi:F-type H+-transporting ATPase subunit gamma
MASTREIRTKIKSVQSTQKITKAMQMVAAAKMRKAQDRTKASRPYALRMAGILSHMARASVEYRHPFLIKRDPVRRVGVIVVSTDKGLCGGLNTNVLRLLVNQMKEWQTSGIEVDCCAIGTRAVGFLQRMGANVVSQVVGLGDTPHLERLIGPVKVMLDAYVEGRIDQLDVFYSRFINTMKQDPWQAQMLPLRDFYYGAAGEKIESKASDKLWDYIYEPDARDVLDALFVRYAEAMVYQFVAENMASEQSARMVAMKAASDNAGNIIDELTLIANKTRQAAITREISEIVGGAAAV